MGVTRILAVYAVIQVIALASSPLWLPPLSSWTWGLVAQVFARLG
jgi:hypothetical protein